MSEELSRIAKRADDAATLASEARQFAAENKGLLESIQNQTRDQWERIEGVSRTVERTAVILDNAVQNQTKLEDRFAKQNEKVSAQDTQINQAIGGANVFKWIASIGGGAGVLAVLKSFFNLPTSG